jgi:hypothetical protein
MQKILIVLILTFLATETVNNQSTKEVVVKKCCAPGDRMDNEEKICTGVNRIEFKFEVIDTPGPMSLENHIKCRTFGITTKFAMESSSVTKTLK